MSAWADEIERDLSWRESEMGALKLMLASAGKGSDRQRALLRACSAMLYAHYEGFCKFCWTLMLDTVSRQLPTRFELNEPLAKRSMARVFKSLRGDISDDGLWRFITKEFQFELSRSADFPDEIDTKSNLWPNLAQEINASVGLSCPLFIAHSKELGLLVGRRNKIAHGEKLEIKDVDQFREIERITTTVMHELAICVVDCLERKSYLGSAAEPASHI